ncbi:MAG: hypothetical protein ABSA48_11440 [Terracidiphilus sp.]|jgi:hypothetical protein
MGWIVLVFALCSPEIEAWAFRRRNRPRTGLKRRFCTSFINNLQVEEDEWIIGKSPENGPFSWQKMPVNSG